jgi:hypothetical protein
LGNKKKRNKQRREFTPLSSMKKEGSKLRGPLSQFNITLQDWQKDILPEHLWIAALANQVGLDHFHNAYRVFLDAIDEYWTSEDTMLGFISDFGLFPNDKRETFIEKNTALIDELFNRPVGRVLSLYPDNPANWLTTRKFLDSGGPLDPTVELGIARKLVTDLWSGKDTFAGRVRALPLVRLLKHQKVMFSSELQVTKLFPKYPIGLTEGELFLVESAARSILNQIVHRRGAENEFSWPKYFWRHNYDLAMCRVAQDPIFGGSVISRSSGEEISRVITANALVARNYLDLLRLRLRPDIYDPRRDEVLFGLFGRVTRLYVLMCEDPLLWARDTSGIMLRPLAETAITFAYLASAGTNEDFEKFIEYGEGQQKLLMLHLQDSYRGEKSLEGRSPTEMAETSDLWPEVLDIELGHWTKKDARRLAADAGMEDLYRLVFAPASSDLHGSWISLKYSNLVRCSEPLHRGHRLPAFAEPPFFVNTAMAAQRLYARCLFVGLNKLSYPQPEKGLEELVIDDSNNEIEDTP